MTSSIGIANQLAQAIAAQLTRTGAGTAARRPRGEAAAGKGASVAAGAGRRDMNTLIALRVREIDCDDPQRGRKAFRVFLEAVLLARCGERLINDSSFHQLIDDVHGALEADPATKRLIDSAVGQLLQESVKRG